MKRKDIFHLGDPGIPVYDFGAENPGQQKGYIYKRARESALRNMHYALHEDEWRGLNNILKNDQKKEVLGVITQVDLGEIPNYRTRKIYALSFQGKSSVVIFNISTGSVEVCLSSEAATHEKGKLIKTAVDELSYSPLNELYKPNTPNGERE